MKRVLRKIKKGIKLIFAIFYLIYYRIKNINKSKGIAQIVESFNSGGLEQVAANIYKAFKSNGNNSTVICISNNVGPICQQIYNPKDLRIIYYDIVDMIKYCAKNNVKTLIFHYSTFHMILLKLLGFKNYYVIHNTYLWYTPKEWKRLKIKLRFSNGIIAVSEWCKNYFLQKTGIKKIKVILNGINFDNLNSGEICSLNRKKLNIKDNEIVCLTVGSYTCGKNQIGLIGIAEEAIKINKNIKFVCCGPILDKKYYETFKRNLSKSSVNKNFIILDYVPQEEMGNFITEICDIYLQPSIHEAGVPLTVMEALLLGKPVIMTDFMLNKTFPKNDRIIGITPPYTDILEITPEKAQKISYKIKDSSSKKYATEIDNLIKNKHAKFNVKDFEFLSVKRMAKEYIDYIKL